MRGPAGTGGSFGGAPRPAGMVRQIRLRLSGIHSHGALALKGLGVLRAAFSRRPATALAFPVPASATHSSIAEFVAWVNAIRRPSGDQNGCDTMKPTGSEIGRAHV